MTTEKIDTMEKERLEECNQVCNENGNGPDGIVYGDSIRDEEYTGSGAAVVYAIIGIGIIAIIILASLLL